MLAASRKHAGVLLDTLSNPERRRCTRDVEWMPSHRAFHAEADAEQRRNNAGTCLADVAAKEARSRHHQAASDDVAEAEFYMKMAKWLAQVVAIAMGTFPPRSEK